MSESISVLILQKGFSCCKTKCLFTVIQKIRNLTKQRQLLEMFFSIKFIVFVNISKKR